MSGADDSTPMAGTHLLADFSDCAAAFLDDPQTLEALLVEAAQAAGATVVARVFHQFRPQGVTGVLVIRESHLSIHTWPEIGYVSADFYTCGDCQPHRAFELLRDRLGAGESELVEVRRGLDEGCRMVVQAHRPVETVRIDCTASALPSTVRVGTSPGRGFGLFATRDLAPGEVVYTVTGLFISWYTDVAMVTDLGVSMLTADDAAYELGLHVVEQWSDRLVDAVVEYYGATSREPRVIRALLTDERSLGLLADFDALVNHSTAPNAFLDWPETTIRFEDGVPRLNLVLRAKSAIRSGEELFADYADGDYEFVSPEGWRIP